MISIENLTVRYAETTVLNNFSLNLTKGEIYSLIGPSGCGKSSLLKVLCGIHKYDKGSILYNGKNINESDVVIGYVPQLYGLLDWKTVKENIYLPLSLDKSKAVREQEIAAILQSLEIEDLLNRYPTEISGGQKQRVALARAFICQPTLLLMDEPFSALDAFTSAASQKLFLKLWAKYRVTTLFITHNIHEATIMGKHILLMGKSSGQIIHQIENKTFDKQDNTLDRLKLVDDITQLFAKTLIPC